MLRYFAYIANLTASKHFNQRTNVCCCCCCCFFNLQLFAIRLVCVFLLQNSTHNLTHCIWFIRVVVVHRFYMHTKPIQTHSTSSRRPNCRCMLLLFNKPLFSLHFNDGDKNLSKWMNLWRFYCFNRLSMLENSFEEKPTTNNNIRTRHKLLQKINKYRKHKLMIEHCRDTRSLYMLLN